MNYETENHEQDQGSQNYQYQSSENYQNQGSDNYQTKTVKENPVAKNVAKKGRLRGLTQADVDRKAGKAKRRKDMAKKIGGYEEKDAERRGELKKDYENNTDQIKKNEAERQQIAEEDAIKRQADTENRRNKVAADLNETNEVRLKNSAEWDKIRQAEYAALVQAVADKIAAFQAEILQTKADTKDRHDKVAAELKETNEVRLENSAEWDKTRQAEYAALVQAVADKIAGFKAEILESLNTAIEKATQEETQRKQIAEEDKQERVAANSKRRQDRNDQFVDFIEVP